MERAKYLDIVASLLHAFGKLVVHEDLMDIKISFNLCKSHPDHMLASFCWGLIFVSLQHTKASTTDKLRDG